MPENTDQNNFEYRQFLCSDFFLKKKRLVKKTQVGFLKYSQNIFYKKL